MKFQRNSTKGPGYEKLDIVLQYQKIERENLRKIHKILWMPRQSLYGLGFL